MPVIDENSLSELLLDDVNLRLIEPHIYSVCQNDEEPNFFDRLARFYDVVICNPLYNRLMWGYSTQRYDSFTHDALTSSNEGWVLDAGCGSLAFSAKTYATYSERPVVFMDQSLKLLRIAKSRLIGLNGDVPANMVFLQGDALQLPFKSKSFHTIISLNLLHVLNDLKSVMLGLKTAMAEKGSMSFSTLIKNNRRADKNLAWMLKKTSGVDARDIGQIQAVFDELGLPVKYWIDGNMAFLLKCVLNS